MIDLIKTKEIETHLADLPKYDKETQQKIIDTLNLLNGLAKSQKIETESIDLKLTYIKEDSAQIDYTLKIRKNLIKNETIKIGKEHIIKRKNMFIDNKTSMLSKIDNIMEITMLQSCIKNIFYAPTDKFIHTYFTLTEDKEIQDNLIYFNMETNITSLEKYKEVNINKQVILNILAAQDRYCIYILKNIPLQIQYAINTFNLQRKAKPQVIFI